MIARLILGDCADVLRQLAPASIDALITDPPAGIGFMGRSWDRDRGGRNAWIEWLASIMRLAFVAMKPGAHALVWALPRTSHWTATAIEDAGFEIRDVHHHIFGCLSDDTEILVDGGWEPYRNATVGRLALCYDAVTDELSWQPIQERYEYDYADTAFRLTSDRTDQIVTRGHRCLVERDGSMVFQIADTLDREARVPVLEDVPAVLDAIPLPNRGAGNASDLSSLLAGIHAEIERQAIGGDLLHDRMRGAGSRGTTRGFRPPPARGCDGAQRMDRGEHGQLPREDERTAQSGMEGWRNDLQDAWQLRGGSIRTLSGGAPVDGAAGRIRHGASSVRGAGDRPMPPAIGSGPPSRSRPEEQPDRESRAVRDEQRPQAIRASRFATADMVRVVPFRYVGRVWCVRVSTGAFVARRNGHAFITGNSGFPKSLDVSKAIDAHLGSTGARVKIGDGKGRTGSAVERHADVHGDDAYEWPGAFAITAPGSPESARWSGFGTALKPAVEHWILARRPLVGTVAENVLAHGTGALNIDGCRIGTSGATKRSGQADYPQTPDGREDRTLWARTGHDRIALPLGRWPAHLSLDEDAARVLDEQSGTLTSGGREGLRGTALGLMNDDSWRPREIEIARPIAPSSGGASRYFYVAKASRSERTNDGRVANDHPTVKSIALMRWLIRLITPPGGLVLDPFAGSGSTGVACADESMAFLGIEQDPSYHAIALARLRLAYWDVDETPLDGGAWGYPVEVDAPGDCLFGY